MKVNIIYGSIKNYNEKIPKEDVISLSEFVRWLDARRNNPVEDQLIGVYKSLTVSTEEYGGVTDAFLEMFVLSILIYQQYLKYEVIYLHNPPKRIFDQIQIYKEKFEISIEKSSYNTVTIDSLRRIKNDFEDHIVGQEEVKNNLLLSLYELTKKSNSKPKVIMLYGPPGVGKTETAHFINKSINDDHKILRKQFSMFHNESFYSYIFGDRSNSFAKDLMDRESNIILLDEFDKCNSIFFSAFYQLFDEGVYEDKFYEVDLSNALILCTSNYLSEDDIRKNLGEAIFSRFDAFIKFNEFTPVVKELLIDKIYEEEISHYSYDEIEVISQHNVPNLLKQYLTSINNARDIRRYLKQMIAVPLIKEI